MADSKSYIVNYDITANAASAEGVLRGLTTIVEGTDKLMVSLKENIVTVNTNVRSLQDTLKAFQFKPMIDVTGFNNQLNKMVADVEAAAGKMAVAIQNAMTTPKAKQLIQQKGKGAFGDEKAAMAQLEKELKAIESKYKSITGSALTNRAGRVKIGEGSELWRAKANGQTAFVNRLEKEAKELKAKYKETQSLLSTLRKAEKEAAKPAAKTTVAPTTTKKAPTSNQPITPATIKAWEKAFGNTKSKTLTLQINANAGGSNGAQTVIEQLKAKIATLKSVNIPVSIATAQLTETIKAYTPPTITVNATVKFNPAQIKEQITGAAKAATATPVATSPTKEGQPKPVSPQRVLQDLRAKADKYQTRLVANRAKYAENPNDRLLAGRITQDTRRLEETNRQIAAQEKVIVGTAPGKSVKPGGKVGTSKAASTVSVTPIADTAKLMEQIRAVSGQNVEVFFNAKWKKGIGDKLKQLKSLNKNLPPVELGLDTTAAKAKFDEFIAHVKANSVQNVTLTAAGASSSATGGKALQAGAAGAGGAAVQAMKAGTAPKGFVGSGKNRVFFGEQQPHSSLAPKGYHWEQTNRLAPLLTGTQAQGYQEALRVKAQAEKLSGEATKNVAALTKASSKANAKASRGARMLSSQPWAIANLEEQIAAQEKLLAQHKSALQKRQQAYRSAPTEQNMASMRGYAQQYATTHKRLQGLRSQMAFWQDLPKTVQETQNVATRVASQAQAATAHLSANKGTWQTQIAAPGQYTNGWRLAEDNPRAVSQSSSRQAHGRASQGNLMRAEQLRAQAHNAMLPFAHNKSQINDLIKYRKFFRQASATTGIVPTAGMSANQMLPYLNAVSQQMQKASVAVPWSLQSQITKLQAQQAKAAGVNPATAMAGGATSRGAGYQKPFDAHMRKWAYPFTGPTSFGVRTPMAVDMAKGMGVMFAIGGAMSAIGSSFSQAMEYQNTMRTTKAILQNGTNSYTKDSFSNMEHTVRDVGVKTKFSAPEVAGAAKFLAMAGFDIEGINAAIRPIADLALIGDLDLSETADKMTNIMTTFGVTPDILKKNPNKMREFANIMTTTATRSNTDLMMLAESAKYGGGVANMYGYGDPNLFADTMALFGVMGNAGIQGSSAGTALRMMYQNTFKSNKNQTAQWEALKAQYGIERYNQDGSKKAMSDILTQIAKLVPTETLADIVGNLYRITAQPGATAAIMAAAESDGSNAEEVAAGLNAMADAMTKDGGLSQLARLMEANRAAVNGNISGAVAEEKQNTISGLWAQVTSTFTEGIVKAFESREGGFEQILIKLRDYLGKPETVRMISNLIDMIIEVGKVMAWFVDKWAKLYNAVPGLVKWWMIIQMGLTQFGALMTPIISLGSALSRLTGIMGRLTGVSWTAGTAMAAGVPARASAGASALAASGNAALLAAPLVSGKKAVSSGAVAHAIKNKKQARAIISAEDAFITSMMMRNGVKDTALNRTAVASMNGRVAAAMTHKHGAEVYMRARKMARPRRVFMRNFSATRVAGTALSIAPLGMGLRNVGMGLLGGLGKAIGFLCNPITLAIGAVGGFGYAMYKFVEHVNGTSDAQIQAVSRIKSQMDSLSTINLNNAEWYNQLMEAKRQYSVEVKPDEKEEKAVEEHNKQLETAKNLYGQYVGLSKDASVDSNAAIVKKWREEAAQNPLFKLSLGNEYADLLGDNLTNRTKKYNQVEVTPAFSPSAEGSEIGQIMYNSYAKEEDNAIDLTNRGLRKQLMFEGGSSVEAQRGVKEIMDLYADYQAKNLTYDQYLTKAREVRDRFANPYASNLYSSEGVTASHLMSLPDRSIYQDYQWGLYNVLNAYANGDVGTWTGIQEGYAALREGITAYSDDWWNAINKVMGDMSLTYNVVAENGQQHMLNLQISTLDNGRIDYSGIVAQIQQRVGQFNLTLQDFANMCAQVYLMLAQVEGIGDTKADYQNFVYEQTQHQHINEKSARKEYAINSYWKNHNISEDQYVKWITNSKRENLKVGDKSFNNASERVKIRRRNANRAGGTAYDSAQALKKKTKELQQQQQNINKQKTPDVDTSDGGGSGDKGDSQQDYASHYDKHSAKPTQVIININELAHFDRTMVASSAEEQDLLAAMEGRIANAVYRIFAEASNQAQQIAMA